MRDLEAQGVDRRRILYLSFEDDRLLPLHAGELDLILTAHEELYPKVAGQRRYVFFDEVQNAPSWETYVRRLHDTEDVSLFVTGSSSHLLSRDLATGLRGRSISYEVFPLSFEEFLRFRGIEREPYSRTSDSRLVAALEEYLATGGLPEVVLADETLRPRILKEYVDLLFYKDLVERHRIGNPRLMRLLLRHCLAHPASLFSAHKVYQDLRSQGLSLAKDTLYAYMEHLEDSYVVFTLPVAERSLRKQAVNPKKLHPVDWALAHPFVPETRVDLGKKLETAVFLHWRRQQEDLGYLGGDREVDLAVGRERPSHLINVTYTATASSTWAREVGSLEAAAGRFPDAARVLVAHEHRRRRPPEGVEVEDAWRHLLGERPVPGRRTRRVTGARKK
jgi:predicted AAA+ superfamily ATPase